MHGTRDDPLAGGHPEPAAASSPSAEVESAVERLRPEIARAVRRVCPRWLADEADDLTQTALTRVLARVRATAGQLAYTSGYLYRAAYSAVVDEIRRRRRLREVPIESELHSSRPDDPDRRARAAEIRDAVAGCLERLVESRRRAVMLHLQGHPVAETSELLGCGTKKAENLIYRGLADLRACLAARGVTP